MDESLRYIGTPCKPKRVGGDQAKLLNAPGYRSAQNNEHNLDDGCFDLGARNGAVSVKNIAPQWLAR